MKKLICLILIFTMVFPLFSVYAEEETIEVYINGEILEFDVNPIIDNGTTLVPFRKIFEALGASVEWSDETGSVKANIDDVEILLGIGSTVASVNGVNKNLLCAPKLTDGRTLIPLRFVSEAIGADVQWDGKNQRIFITLKEDKMKKAPEIPPIDTTSDPLGHLPEGEVIYTMDDFKGEELRGTYYGTSEWVPVEDMPFDEALEVNVTKQTSAVYNIRFITRATSDIEENDLLVVSWYQRTLEAFTDDSCGQVRIIYEEDDTWAKSIDTSGSAGAKWQRFIKTFKIKRNLPKETHSLHLWFGGYIQRVQIAGLQVINYKDTVEESQYPKTQYEPYEGMEPDAAWREEADARIEKYRKGDISLNVKDENGNPVKDAVVNVDMKRHDFDFGAVLWTAPGGNEEQMFYDTIKQYFNTVVIGNALKWGAFENYRNNAIKAVDWAVENGLKVRGHTLIWDSLSHMPDDVRAIYKDREKIDARIKGHIQDEVGEFVGKIHEWDVVNEPVRNINIRTTYGHEIVADWYEWAKASDPYAEMWINETGILGYDTKDYRSFLRIIDELNMDNVDYDGIGIQGHFGAPCNPVDYYNQLDTIHKKSGKPIKITEYTMNSDEIIKGNFTRDILTTVFSHEAANGFVNWGHYAGKTDAGTENTMFKGDWTLNYAGEQYVYLVMNKWWTNATVRTDDEGYVPLRVFYGDYDIKVTVDGKEYTDEIRFEKGDDGNFDIILGSPNTLPNIAYTKLYDKFEPSDLEDDAWKIVKEYDFDEEGDITETDLVSANLNYNANLMLADDGNGGNAVLAKHWANYTRFAIMDVFSDLDTSLSTVYKITFDAKLGEDATMDEAFFYPTIAKITGSGARAAISATYNIEDADANCGQNINKNEWKKIEMIYILGKNAPDGISFNVPADSDGENQFHVMIDNVKLYSISEDYSPDLE